MLSFPACVSLSLRLRQNSGLFYLPKDIYFLYFWSKLPFGTFFLFRQVPITHILAEISPGVFWPTSVWSGDSRQVARIHPLPSFFSVILSFLFSPFKCQDPMFLCRIPFPEFHDLLLSYFVWRSTFSLPKKRVHEEVNCFCFLFSRIFMSEIVFYPCTISHCETKMLDV